MTDEVVDSLATDFAALLSVLEASLTPDQVWELETFADYDEHEVAFGLLCSLLQRLDAPIPEQGVELLEKIASDLGLGEAHWRTLPCTQRH